MGELTSILNTTMLVFTILVVLYILGISALGLRKSWKHSVIILGRCISAALLAFVSAKILSSVASTLVSDALGGEFSSLIGESLGQDIASMPTLVGFISGIPIALITPFLFVLFFWIWDLLLLIPQIFVKKAVLKDEIKAKKEKRKPDIAWKSRGISAGIRFANAVIVILIVMLPLSCLLAVVSDAYVAIETLMDAPSSAESDYSEDYGEESVDLYDDVLSPITNSPVIAAASNPLARVIYSNLTEIRVGETVCYLDQEILSICDVLENVTALTSADISEFGEDQKLAIKNVASYVSESEFRCNLICEFVSLIGDQAGGDDFVNSILGIFSNPETIGDDLNALADLFGVLIDHDMFASLSGEGEGSDSTAAFEKFADKEFLEDLLTAVNPSQNCRNILPSVLNLAISSLADNVTTTVTNVPELTPEQITAEAATISDIFSTFTNLSDSPDGASIDDMTVFGEFYDKSQKSIILKDAFKAVFIALLKSEAFSELGDFGDIIARYIENDPDLNMTKVITATQQLAKIFSNYGNGTATDLAALQSDLNALINSVDDTTAKILSEMLESDSFNSGNSDNKSAKIFASIINSMATMENLSEEELERETKAFDYLIKISSADSDSSVFGDDNSNSDEMMEAILNSNISVTAINELAYDEDGNLTESAREMSENFTDEDKANVHSSAENYYKQNAGSLNAEEKETLQKNMNAIASIFGNDLSGEFSGWDAEING